MDRLELIDLLQADDSPFRTIATSSSDEKTDGSRISSFISDAPPVSWDSHRMIPLEWGFQLSPSMEELCKAIRRLHNLDLHYCLSHLSVRTCDFVFRSLSQGKGTNHIEFSLSHLTAQWNPSTVIALQRFLGRMKKATTTILSASTNIIDGDGNRDEFMPQTPIPDSASVLFSVKANIESISISLSKYLFIPLFIDRTKLHLIVLFNSNSPK